MNEIIHTLFDSLPVGSESKSDIFNNITGDNIEERTKSAIVFLLDNGYKINYEVERKILEIDLDELSIVLENMGAKLIYDGKITDNRFDFEDMFLRKNGIIVRARETVDKNYFALKKQNISVQNSINNEFDEPVDDIKKTITACHDLGMKLIDGKTYSKLRKSYFIEYLNLEGDTKKVKFDFDKYPGIPWLLEIESDKEEDITYWTNKLRLKGHEQVTYGYRKLRDLYKAKELEKLSKIHEEYKKST